jgi:HAD superfamily hydrolase (TIGR01490 family)
MQKIALFDFDGTLLPWDTQKLFCHHVLRRHPQRRWYLPLFLMMLPCTPVLGAEGMKRVFLSFLWKLPQQDVDELARDFARKWVPAQIWPEMREILEEHRRAGDLTILISASPEPYVKEVGRLLGFDLAFGTVVDFPDGGLPLFPDLINNKGWEKVRRLRRELPADVFVGDQLQSAHGYTDSCADLPMLTLCQQATVVNPSKRLREIAESSGWAIMSLPRPWRNRWQRAWHRLFYLVGSDRIGPPHRNQNR